MNIIMSYEYLLLLIFFCRSVCTSPGGEDSPIFLSAVTSKEDKADCAESFSEEKRKVISSATRQDTYLKEIKEHDNAKGKVTVRVPQSLLSIL